MPDPSYIRPAADLRDGELDDHIEALAFRLEQFANRFEELVAERERRGGLTIGLHPCLQSLSPAARDWVSAELAPGAAS